MLTQFNPDAIQNNAFTGALGVPDKTVPTNIAEVINNILPYVFGAASFALLVYLILGGFQFMTSRGDPKAAQAAQAKITNALIGFVIVIFAFVIIKLFGQIFGIEGTFFGTIFS